MMTTAKTDASYGLGFTQPISAVVIAANGGVGSAFCAAIKSFNLDNRVWATSRSDSPIHEHLDAYQRVDLTDEADIEALVHRMKSDDFTPNLVINCSGLLHSNKLGPEKTWRHLDLNTMRTVFEVNTFGVALLGKHLIPIMPRNERAVFASLSARVGSIGDNRLGGWYSYRASKAAQNMIMKTLALEAQRRWPALICAGLHPGTVKTALSDPFSSRVPAHKLFSKAQSVGYLCDVIARLDADDTGGFFAWDGSPIPY